MRWIDHPTPVAPPPLPALHPLISSALIRRGLADAVSAWAFLDPDSYHPSPAADLPGLAAAAECITASIKRREPICIWGDFDVDGQTSTTVLVQTLQAIGADVSYHIPVRARESHGVNIENLARIIDGNAKLILTCDTGISAHPAVEYARSRGVDFVITDHHDLPATLPAACAIANPKFLPKNHPLGTLAGVGVAYKLAETLLTQFSTDLTPDALLDLVALGLVADMAILTVDARYLVQKGLRQIRATQRLGLKTIMELAELNPVNLSEEHIGFQLAPRLNALGRLDDANPAVELFLTHDPIRARVLAAHLEGLNAQRKLLCDQVLQAAESQLRADPGLLAQPVIILHHPSWPGGVVGIAASGIVERYRKPAILLTGSDGIVRGSARSIEGLNITAAISSHSEMLGNFGGHPMAAGLSLPFEKLPEFRRKLGKTIEKMLAESQVEEETITIDGWISLAEADLALAEQLEQLAPYGPGNEKLVLATRSLTLKSNTILGKNREHSKLTVEDESGESRQVLWWDGALNELPDGKFDLAFSLRSSDWRGVRQPQLELIDFRIVELEKVTLQAQSIEIIDRRGNSEPEKELAEYRLQHATAIWIEGEDKKRLGGLGRHHLPACEKLIIWSTPPSPEVLRSALETVHPRCIVIFAIDPASDDPKDFLARLAGIIKFIINKKAGETTYAELAASTAQTELAARKGVEWLIKRGQLTGDEESGGTLRLAASNARADKSAAARVMSQIQSILKETAAYRAHVHKAGAQSLLE